MRVQEALGIVGVFREEARRCDCWQLPGSLMASADELQRGAAHAMRGDGPAGAWGWPPLEG